MSDLDKRAGTESVDDILEQVHRAAHPAAAAADGDVDAILASLGRPGYTDALPRRPVTAPAPAASRAEAARTAAPAPAPAAPAKQSAAAPLRPAAPPAADPERPAAHGGAHIVDTPPLAKPIVDRGSRTETETLELTSLKAYSQMQEQRIEQIQRAATEAAMARAAAQMKGSPYNVPGVRPHTENLGVEVDERFIKFFGHSVADTRTPREREDDEGFAAYQEEQSAKPARGKASKKKHRFGMKNVFEKATHDADELSLTGELDAPMLRGEAARAEQPAPDDDPDADLFTGIDGMEQADLSASAAPAAPDVPAPAAPRAAASAAPAQQLLDDDLSAPVRPRAAAAAGAAGAAALAGTTAEQADLSARIAASPFAAPAAAGAAPRAQRPVLRPQDARPSRDTCVINRLDTDTAAVKTTAGGASGTFTELTITVPLTETSGRPLDVDKYDLDASDYNHLTDAPAVTATLKNMRITRLLRVCVTGVIAALLFYLDAMARFRGTLPFLGGLDAKAQPLVFLGVNLVLLVLAGVVCLTTMGAGLAGLGSRHPSADTLPALAVLGCCAQLAVCMLHADTFEPSKVTIFAPVAVLALCANAVGKWLHSLAVSRSFGIASAGYDHWAAFLVPNRELTKMVCTGLGEPEPLLLVSRPTELVKGFMRQSFSAHPSDAIAHKLSLLVLLSSALCGVIAGLQSQSVLLGISGGAAALCLGAPLAGTLVYAVPALRMQKTAARVGAVVPGPSAVRNLGLCNTVLLNAADLFPPSCVRLHGIKTFDKERIDLAILYAASLLNENCVTLRDLFLALVDNKANMLYKVEDPKPEAGYGFSGWINGHEVMIGNREMMKRHSIEIPSLDYERKYTHGGERSIIYLAVGAKVFGMFLVSYSAYAPAQEMLDGLADSGISVLVQSDDFNLTARMVAATYHMPSSSVKVLAQSERDMLAGQTQYLEESEGFMTHTGECTSFVGGMRAAAAAAAGEHLADVLEMAATLFTMLVCVVLSFSLGLAGLSLVAVVLYQLAWCAITVLPPLLRRQ